MGHSLEFILNHPVLSVALFIFIYLIISYEIKNFTKKYKGINCNDLVTKINESQIAVLDTDEVVVYDKDEMTSVSSAEKISKINSIKVFYLEGGIQSWTENNLPLVEGK